MNIELKFDYDSHMVYIPDGYVNDVNSLQSSFLDWVQQQPECLVYAPNKRIGLSYNQYDFLRYLNSVVLKDSKEKAYFDFISPQKSKVKFVICF